jgi:cytochrome c oxidase assembly protein subunit 15
MLSRFTSSRSSDYQPRLAWFAAIGGIWVFVLVMLGAFTTSIGAGMAFLDWPLSNGSLNPEGWLTDIMMFAEHSHRLSAGLMSFITIAVWLAIWALEDRKWVRQLALFAVILVFTQALVGGLRVLFDHLHIESIETSVGRVFAMVHAGLAQVYVCTLLAIVMVLSRGWINWGGRTVSGKIGRLGLWCVGLILLQLAVAAVMRHSHAGLAIPTFPLSTPDGDLLPQMWNFHVSIHFAHRAMALVLTVVLIWFAAAIWRDPTVGSGLRNTAWAIVALLVVQIALGASSIWMLRDPYITTAHVLVGACLLATTFGAAIWANRRDSASSV